MAPAPLAVRWFNRAIPVDLHGEPEFGSLSRETGEEEAAADFRHALAHILQAVTRPAPGKGRGVEPAAVVLDGNFEGAGGFSDSDADFGSAGVLEDVRSEERRVGKEGRSGWW